MARSTGNRGRTPTRYGIRNVNALDTVLNGPGKFGARVAIHDVNFIPESVGMGGMLIVAVAVP
jgi:hypothetical protein